MSEQETDVVDDIRIPEGDNWTCEICGETGDSSTQTMRDHLKENHDWPN